MAAIIIPGTARTTQSDSGDITVIRDKSVAQLLGTVVATKLDPAATAAVSTAVNMEVYGLANTPTLDIFLGGASWTATFVAADFANINMATAAESAAVIERDVNALAKAAGLGKLITAVDVGGYVVVTSLAIGLHVELSFGGVAATIFALPVAVGTGLPQGLQIDIDQVPLDGAVDVADRLYSSLIETSQVGLPNPGRGRIVRELLNNHQPAGLLLATTRDV